MDSYDDAFFEEHSTVPKIDELTHLPTYAEFRKDAKKFLNESQDSDEPFMLIATNLVNFRSFNRLYGFEKGDAYLRDLANELTQVFDGFPIMRYAEDHFYVLYRGADVEARIKKVRDTATDLGKDAQIHFKAGVYQIDPATSKLNTALDKARAACDSIRNDLSEFCCVYNDALLLQQYIIDHVDEAIDKGWIEVWMQPIIRVQTGRGCGIEALTRWNDPTFGLISPAVFIPLLEECNLIGKVDRYVVEVLGRMYAQLVQSGESLLPMSVNFSRTDFETFDVLEHLENVCKTYGIPHSMIQVEVTESVLATNTELMHRQLNAIHDAGFKVWLDDFGSGYSTFNIMQDFNFDLIKLDMDFLRRYSEGAKVGVIITSLIDMAKQLGIQTLAEGVETPEQFMFLKKIGCEKAQGFLFSKPMPARELAKFRNNNEHGTESRTSAAYYDEVGRVDIIGKGFVSFDVDEADRSASLPMAILELHDGKFSYLATNRSYDAYIQDIGFPTLQAAADNLSVPIHTSGPIMRDAIYKTLETHDTVAVDHVDNSFRCTSTIRFICEDPHSGASAYLITSINLTRFNRIEISDLQETVMLYLLDRHDRIDVCLENGTGLRNVYHKTSDKDDKVNPDSLKETLTSYCQRYIHEDDWQDFAAFYDINTIEERTKASPGHIVGQFFRTRDPEDGWVSRLCTISPMTVEGERMYLSCMHNTTMSRLVSQATPEQGFNADLLGSFLDIDGLSIFWKDTYHRYVGCNKTFLEYYGLKSNRDIIGKTSEEMGWIVDPVTFREMEDEVLSGTSIIQAEQEYTILNGDIRKVLVIRAPIKDDSENITGILGMFIDIDEQTFNEGITLEKLDAVTKLYINAYENKGHDFTVCALRLRENESYKKLYGEEFETQMARAMQKAISHELANQGVYCAFENGTFAILHQTDSQSPEHCGICKAIRSIREVNGIPCELKFDRAFAPYSKYQDIDALQQSLLVQLNASSSSSNGTCESI